MSVSIENVYEQRTQIELNKFHPKEAHNRLIISRGYYASFSHACELVNNKKSDVFLLSKDNFNNSYGSHERYYESLIQCSNNSLVEVGNKLKSYHYLRKKADYKLKKHVTDLDVKVANQYLEECKKLMDIFINSLN